MMTKRRTLSLVNLQNLQSRAKTNSVECPPRWTSAYTINAAVLRDEVGVALCTFLQARRLQRRTFTFYEQGNSEKTIVQVWRVIIFVLKGAMFRNEDNEMNFGTRKFTRPPKPSKV